MLCKKCKTALDENAKVCQYCGARTGGVRQALPVVGLCVLVAVVAGSMVYFSQTADTVPEPVTAPQATPEAPAATPVPAEEIPETAMVEALPTPTPPVHTADEDISASEAWGVVENIAVAMNDYYDVSSKTRVILSKNGYMYNLPSKKYFTPKNFSKTESMNQDYVDEQVLLLFMRPDDISEYLPEAGLSGEELTLFAAYETGDGFLVAGRDGRLGIISRENFQSLQELYNDDHGSIMRPEYDTTAFNHVVDGVRKHGGGEYDVRYLVFDDKYAFTVLSEAGTPELLKEYVLVKEADEWVVGLYGFEAEFMYQNIVNSRYPDLNIGLLPPYNLYYEAKYIRNNITPLIDAMRTQGVINDEEDGQTTFATGTDKYCYMEFESGKKLLTVYTGSENGWVVHEINNFLHAEFVMAEYEESPPSFILKQ